MEIELNKDFEFTIAMDYIRTNLEEARKRYEKYSSIKNKNKLEAYLAQCDIEALEAIERIVLRDKNREGDVND